VRSGYVAGVGNCTSKGETMKKLAILAASALAALAVATNAGALRPPVETTCTFAKGTTECVTEHNIFSSTDTLCQDGELFQVDAYATYVEVRDYAGNAVDRNGDVRPHAKLTFEFTSSLHGTTDVTDLGVSC
jgi:hypothetical protein